VTLLAHRTSLHLYYPLLEYEAPPLIVLAVRLNDDGIDELPDMDGEAYKATRIMAGEGLATLSTNN